MCVVFFFFKQKTAYEMRISDWSSDVCSSDLEQLAQIETLVNAQIRGNAEAEVHQMDMQQALDFGAMALFGEKYGERVRVLRMGEFSTELCGGTHVRHTGDIGLFKIFSEGGVAAGIRRIEAMTGAAALRSGEGRVGTKLCRTCCIRWWAYYEKKQNTNTT